MFYKNGPEYFKQNVFHFILKGFYGGWLRFFPPFCLLKKSLNIKHERLLGRLVGAGRSERWMLALQGEPPWSFASHQGACLGRGWPQQYILMLSGLDCSSLISGDEDSKELLTWGVRWWALLVWGRGAVWWVEVENFHFPILMKTMGEVMKTFY